MTKPSRVRGWAGRLAWWGAIGYLLGLAGLALLLREAGERWWLSSVLLFVPPHFWLLPLPGLALLAAWANRRALLWLGAAVVVAVFGLFRFQIGFPVEASPGAEVLKVITNNMGEDNDHPVVPFLLREDADLVVLQDTFRKAASLREAFPAPEWHIREQGRYILVSRYPIRSARLLPMRWRRSPAAAFEVEWKGRLISVYSVHLPTPRTEFRGLGAIRLEKPESRAKYANDHQHRRLRFLKESMEQRVAEVRNLVEVVAADPNPTLLVGDFNMPRWGYLYRVVSGEFTDAFETRGFGFGFTVLAEEGNPLLRLGPWLRIDYIFSDKYWRPLTCRVEGKRQAQHRAVVATLEWRGEEAQP